MLKAALADLRKIGCWDSQQGVTNAIIQEDQLAHNSERGWQECTLG